LKMGLHPSDIVRGYEKACEKAGQLLFGMVSKSVSSLLDEAEVTEVLRSAISSKQSSFEDVLAPLVAKACIQSVPGNDPKKFSVDSVRVAKIVGGGVGDATVVKGVVITKDTEGTIKSVQNSKVAVFPSNFDMEKTDSKHKVFIEKASELENYAKTEEDSMEAKVKAIADSGVRLVVVGGTVGEMAMHFFEKYKIMVLKVASKFELRRVCQACGASPLMRLGAPMPEEAGHFDKAEVSEIGGTRVTTLLNNNSEIATIILRGATENIMDDIERALDDAVNMYKAMTKDNRFVGGAGASDIELSRLLQQFAEQTPGEDQYSINKFGEAFEVVPRTLAENAGQNATSIVATLYAKHMEGNVHFGVDVEGHDVADTVKLKVFDHLLTKKRAIELATNSVVTILRINQIIMAKPAGIPVPSQKGSGSMGSYDTGETM